MGCYTNKVGVNKEVLDLHNLINTSPGTNMSTVASHVNEEGAVQKTRNVCILTIDDTKSINKYRGSIICEPTNSSFLKLCR